MTSAACRNCGEPLTGRFCGACGQSDEDLKRPFFSMMRDAIEDVFDVDGRMLRTIGALYRRPGKVARDYVDGKRARYTPPVRIFLVVSVVFFSAMALAQIRVIALTFDVTGEGADQNVSVEPDTFRFGAPDWPEISAEAIASAQEWAAAEGNGVYRFMARVTYAAMRDPDGLERAATAAAAQAVLCLVAAFALLNALLHPRRRLIEHGVHALYFSAAFLPVIAVLVFLEAGAAQFNLGPFAALAAPVISLAWLYLFDRGFYGSSRLGAALRTVVMFLSFPVLGAAFFALLFALSV